MDDAQNELRSAEENAKRTAMDAAKSHEDLKHEQEHSAQIERLRKNLEHQVKELQSRCFGDIKIIVNGVCSYEY